MFCYIKFIRKENRIYIDKTEYVYRMTHADSKYMFLSRPRRFGKSLLVSTLKSYFEGKKTACEVYCYGKRIPGMSVWDKPSSHTWLCYKLPLSKVVFGRKCAK